MIPGGRPADRLKNGSKNGLSFDGKRSEAEWTLHYAGMKGEWGSGERGSPVGSRTTPADSAKMVPKMKPHFT